MKSLRDYIELVEGQQTDEVLEAATPATAIPPQIANFKNAQPGQEVWLNGTRYKFDPKANPTRKPDGTYSFTPGWKVTMKPGEFGLTGNMTKASTKFTSPELGKQTPPVAVAKAKTPAPQQAAQPAPEAPAQAATPAPAPEAPAAPAAPTGPWPAGSPQDTAWQKLSPEDQKWIGQADPTDQMILARAPNGGKPAAAPAQGAQPAPAAQAAMPGVKAGGEVVDTRGGTQGQDEMEESVSFQNDELTRIVSLVQHR